MKNQTLLIAAGAILAYWLWKNSQKKAAALTPDITKVMQDPNIDLIKSQTVNFQQIAPTPSTIMDMPGSVNNLSYSGCGCNCGGKQLGSMPVIC